MITRQDILEAIAECQGTRSPNANTAIKLAAFYTILDHMEEQQPAVKAVDRNSMQGYSFAGSAVEIKSGTEFAEAINGKPQSEVWPVMDELMTTIKTLNERLYNGVLRKLQM